MPEKLPLSLVRTALKTQARACTFCSSEALRPSRMRTPTVARWLGLVPCRCENCWRLFLLPGRVLELEH